MKPFFDHKFEDVFVDEEENFKKYYQEDIKKGPTRFDKFLKGLRKVFGIAMPGITAVAIPTMLVACQPDKPTPPKPDDQHKHKLTYVSATKESCTQDGTKEHWTCDDCGKTFSDSKGQKEVDEDDLKIQAHHTLTHQTKKDATCTQDGNIDYYHCTACGENFLDENGTNKVDLDDTVIASKGHVVGEKWEHDENGHWKVCGACGQQVDYHAHNFENYVCTECGAEDVNAPLSKEEIVEKIYPVVKENLQNAVGKKSIINNILAIDFDGQNMKCLVDYHRVQGGFELDCITLFEISMNNTFSQETIKSNNYIPTVSSATPIITIPTSEDDRGIDILKKIDPDGDHDHYDFVSVSIGSGEILAGIGATNAIRIYTINKTGVTESLVCAKRDGGTKDPIGESILNGQEGVSYKVYTDSYKFFKFGDNVIYNFDGLLTNTKETTEENKVETIKTNQAPTTLFVSRKVEYVENKILLYELQ